jgi:hypothetical protein
MQQEFNMLCVVSNRTNLFVCMATHDSIIGMYYYTHKFL